MLCSVYSSPPKTKSLTSGLILFWGWRGSNLWLGDLGHRPILHNTPCKTVDNNSVINHAKDFEKGKVVERSLSKSRWQLSFFSWNKILAGADWIPNFIYFRSSKRKTYLKWCVFITQENIRSPNNLFFMPLCFLLI